MYLFIHVFIYLFIYVFIYFSFDIIMCCRPDMTSAVDWALKANYVYLFTWLFILFIFVTMWLICV